MLAAMNAPEAMRIGIVEDDPILRAAVRRTVEQRPGWVLALDADCRAAATPPPLLDVLLLDIGLPDGSGLDLIGGFQRSGCKVIVFTVMGDEATVLRAIELGATGYLLKHADAGDMLAAIDEVMAGGAPLTPSVAAHVLARLRNADRSTPRAAAEAGLAALTAREQEVLLALARGYTYGETAELLQISAHTVGDHVKRIYSKLAVRSRAEAVFEVVQAGWLSRGSD
jgi:DNA-binding NarL/FixJ family response regulator